jgi:hypothetical protein
MNAAWLGEAVYPLGEAARLSHLSPLTVRRWLEGYDYKHKGERRRSQPVSYLAKAKTDADEPRTHEPTLDFEQLLTLMLVRAFRDRGLSLPKIKAAAAKARDLYDLANPFVSKQFRSDGHRIFVDLEPKARGRGNQLVDVLSDQQQFREIVEPSLFRDVVFVGGRAGQWWPMGRDRSVVLAPSRQFGAPHITGTGVRTDVVADMVTAEGGDETRHPRQHSPAPVPGVAPLTLSKPGSGAPSRQLSFIRLHGLG